MGHVRIRVLIARELLPVQHCEKTDNDEWHAVVHLESADATLRDVYEKLLEPLSLPDGACLWDCTLYPPKDITDWLSLYNEKTGPRSKTLYDAGWFPSGIWQVLPRGRQPVHSQNYDDVQYNIPSSAMISTLAVQLVDQEKSVTPSQVLQSAVQRFPQEDDPDNHDRALEIRRLKRNEKEKKERDRNAKLEERIHCLQFSSQPVSQQVKRMLIKSRCTNSGSLKVQDRVHLHVVIILGTEETIREEYRCFSRQDTVARILRLAPNRSPFEAELLVRVPDSGLLRLPTIMRLHEAIASNYIQEVDSVVIRCFTPPEEEPTTSILDSICNTDMEENGEVPSVATFQVESPSSIQGMEAETTVIDDAVSVDICNQMTQAIATMDATTSSKSKKKASTGTCAKVRTMLIKSKAKGDAKRIPKMEHRFFLELVVIQTVDGKCVASAFPVFLSKTDPVGRLLRDCVSVPSGLDAMLLVPNEQGGFHRVLTDISLQDAETRGLVKSFDRVVVLLHKKS